jgi:hypothetical protein
MTTDAQKILDMIEKVDPADTQKLDEIDARVWCYMRGFVFEHADSNFVKANGQLPHLGFSKYTRSRDALKSIRKHLQFDGVTRDNRFDKSCGHFTAYFTVYIQDNNEELSKALHGHGFTEELAELHAIIQAIEYERKSHA